MRRTPSRCCRPAIANCWRCCSHAWLASVCNCRTGFIDPRVTAVLAAALVERLIAAGVGDQLLKPTLIVIAIGSALTGILLCGLGLARAGRAIRFVPYPVIGGFLGATGWLVVSGAVLVVTDFQLDKRTFWRKANIMCGVRDVR